MGGALHHPHPAYSLQKEPVGHSSMTSAGWSESGAGSLWEHRGPRKSEGYRATWTLKLATRIPIIKEKEERRKEDIHTYDNYS